MTWKSLSKSNYLAGLQCPKLLWIKVNEKDRIPEPDETKQLRFTNGYEIEALAKSLFEEGVDLSELDYKENLKVTEEKLHERRVLFEPSFNIDRLYSRADVLVPVEDNEWDVYEIKSSTKVKDINVHDLSFQRHVYEKAGLRIRDVNLIHVNTEYVYNGKILIPRELFTIANLNEQVQEASEGLEKRIESFLKIIDGNEPTVDIGPHCTSPYSCDLRELCWAGYPEDNVFNLYYAKKDQVTKLRKQGIHRIADIPLEFDLTANQHIQRVAHITGNEQVNDEKVREFLQGLKYPLYFMDFETINPGIPKFKGTKPYQRLPFQYSLHIQDTPEENPRHIEFLHTEDTDPREPFLRSLQENLGKEGTIVVYNKSFEESLLRETAKAYPTYQAWVNKVKPRMTDLLVPFRNFWYYHPGQNGSTSIKSVLPVLGNSNYDNLSIAKGEIANIRYEAAVYGNMSPEERESVFIDLREYCKQDTQAEIDIIVGLRRITT